MWRANRKTLDKFLHACFVWCATRPNRKEEKEREAHVAAPTLSCFFYLFLPPPLFLVLPVLPSLHPHIHTSTHPHRPHRPNHIMSDRRPDANPADEEVCHPSQSGIKEGRERERAREFCVWLILRGFKREGKKVPRGRCKRWVNLS